MLHTVSAKSNQDVLAVPSVGVRSPAISKYVIQTLSRIITPYHGIFAVIIFCLIFIFSSTVDAKSEEATKMEKGKSALNKVLESLCIHHHQQVLAMLKFLVQEQNAASICCCNSSCTMSSESQKPLFEDDFHGLFCRCEYRLAERGCLHNERQNPGLMPLPVCIKELHCLSCQTVTVEHIKTVMNSGIESSYNAHRCCCGQLAKNNSTKSAFHSPLLSREVCDLSDNLKDACRSRSPSPPPLSPVETGGFEKWKDIVSELSTLENNKLETSTNQPPSLTPAEISIHKCDQDSKINKTKQSSNFDSVLLDTSSSCTSNYEKGETTVIFQDLMDRINEKLKSIETTDTSNLIKLSSTDCDSDNDFKLGDLITSLLHSATASDYSFMELLSQHDKKVENKIIQTRFRKRQQTLFAMHNSPDSPVIRRQSLQIKRELASLDENFLRKRYSEKNPRKLSCNDKMLSLNKEFQPCQEPLKNSKSFQDENHAETLSSPNDVAPSLQLPLESLGTSMVVDQFSENIKAASSEKMSQRKSPEKCTAEKLIVQNNSENTKLENTQTLLRTDAPCLLSRTKRNIVPPGWYSIYVTNNSVSKKFPEGKRVSDSAHSKDPCKDSTESLQNRDLNKIAMNSNLQVVVERLEDTINMAQRSWTNQAQSEGFKASKKLIGTDGKDQNGIDLTCTLSRMACKSQGLSKSIIPSSNKRSYDMPVMDLNKRPHNPKIAPILERADLTSSVESVPTKCEGIESSVSNYSSPIKLMFLSEIKSSEGIKYTLTSVSTSQSNAEFSSHKHKTHQVSGRKREAKEDIPCISFEDYGSNHDINCLQSKLNKFNCVQEATPSSAEFTDSLNSDKPQEDPEEKSSGGVDLPYKRKPGRPKKIGPQVVKQTKRPIGRPPKPKADQTDVSIGQNESFNAGKKNLECLSEVNEGIYRKSITVTVVYGRSRRTKRCVSEGTVNISNISLNSDVSDFAVNSSSLRNAKKYETDCGEGLSAVSRLTTESGFFYSDFEYVRPIKTKSVIPQASKNVIRPNQKPLSIVRKPGRPAKVKISGISVTISRISPHEREVCLSSCLPPLEQETMLEKTCREEKLDQQCSKLDKVRPTDVDIFKNESNSAVVSIPPKHSIRTRKPFHFLHSLASSGSLTYKSALRHKSCKLHLQKGKSPKKKYRQSSFKLASKRFPGSRRSRKAEKCLEDKKLTPISEVSLDPVISSSPLLRWWATSTSNDSLLEELNNRFEQITNAWVQVSRDEAQNPVHRAGSTESDGFKATSPMETCLVEFEVSPVKMLFQKKYNLNELCTWFMQTTETQSLSLVRKANARNPLEVISTKGIKLGVKCCGFNASPFRKHFKKFAVSSPSKSAGKFHILHKMVGSPLLNVRRNLTLARLKRTEFKSLHCERWKKEEKPHSHRTIDWNSKRRNLRFFCQNQFLTKTERETNAVTSLSGKGTVGTQWALPLETRVNFPQERVAVNDITTTDSLESQVKSETKENGTGCGQTGSEKGQRLENVFSNNWKSKTLKDCRIFLRKINCLENRNTFKLNTIIYSPESVDSEIQVQGEESKRFNLRSHSARQNSFKTHDKERGNAKTTSPASDRLTDELYSSQLSKVVSFEKNPDHSETLSKLNKRKRPPWKTTEMPPKRHKRQSCNSGQKTNCCTKSQVGKFFSP